MVKWPPCPGSEMNEAPTVKPAHPYGHVRRLLLRRFLRLLCLSPIRRGAAPRITTGFSPAPAPATNVPHDCGPDFSNLWSSASPPTRVISLVSSSLTFSSAARADHFYPAHIQGRGSGLCWCMWTCAPGHKGHRGGSIPDSPLQVQTPFFSSIPRAAHFLECNPR